LPRNGKAAEGLTRNPHGIRDPKRNQKGGKDRDQKKQERRRNRTLPNDALVFQGGFGENQTKGGGYHVKIFDLAQRKSKKDVERRHGMGSASHQKRKTEGKYEKSLWRAVKKF